jgi:hypothetical protein
MSSVAVEVPFNSSDCENLPKLYDHLQEVNTHEELPAGSRLLCIIETEGPVSTVYRAHRISGAAPHHPITKQELEAVQCKQQFLANDYPSFKTVSQLVYILLDIIRNHFGEDCMIFTYFRQDEMEEMYLCPTKL